MTQNLDDLLNIEKVTFLFRKYQQQLGLSDGFNVREVKRNTVLSPNSYILLIKVEDNNKEILIRGNASKSRSRLNGYEALKILYHNGFGQGNYRVAKPLIFVADYNLILYENISGSILINELKIGNLEEKIILCAQWLRRLHWLNLPVKVQKYNFEFSLDFLGKFYPDLAKNAEKIKTESLSKLRFRQQVLIHGDFQPNNIIIDKEKIFVIDLNDMACDNPMIDLASFLSQLKTMLLRYSDVNKYDSLEKLFLNEYEKTNKLTDEMRQDINVYRKLFYIKILASLCASVNQQEANKKEFLNQIYQYYEEM